jgi:hypothetical protein
VQGKLIVQSRWQMPCSPAIAYLCSFVPCYEDQLGAPLFVRAGWLKALLGFSYAAQFTISPTSQLHAADSTSILSSSRRSIMVARQRYIIAICWEAAP